MPSKQKTFKLDNEIHIERKHRNLNIVSGLAATLITALLAFVFTFFLINHIGTTINGKQKLILTIVSYFSLAEGGMTIGIASKLYKPLRDGNHEEVTRIYNGMKKMYKLIGLFYISIGLIGAIAFSLVSSGITDSSKILFVFALFMINVLPGFLDYFFLARYVTLLQADNKSYLINMALAFFKIFSYTIAICLVVFVFKEKDLIINSHDITGINENHTVKSTTLPINKKAIIALVAIGIVEFANVVVYAGVYLLKRHYFQNMLVKDVKEAQKIHAIILYTFIYKLSTMVVFSTDAITLSFASHDQSKSFLLLTLYSLYSSVVSIFKNIFVAMLDNTRSFVGRNMSSQKYKDKIIRDLYGTSILFACVIFMAITVISPIAIDLVFNKNKYFMPTISLLLAVTMFLYLLSTPSRIIVEAKGDFKGTWKIIAAEAVINLVISIGLVFKFTIYGVIIATIISMTFKLIAFEIYAYKKWGFTLFTKPNARWILMVIFTITFVSISQWWLLTHYERGFDFTNGWMKTWLNPIQLFIVGVTGLISMWAIWFILFKKDATKGGKNEINS
ncbi:polysaccharide biosynthesis C-terminal domain-containing protein [Mycoplasma todarodis]|uniref:polysaccharide biosynthesis C-terminal domain-containing protein n=1 Tax=Mycoplasma todarodis TaxID=1937191 RepID=UPI003B336CCB